MREYPARKPKSIGCAPTLCYSRLLRSFMQAGGLRKMPQKASRALSIVRLTSKVRDN
jgi:hypothetical protein